MAVGQAQQPCDKLTVEAKTLADLMVEKAAVNGERRTVEADLGPVRFSGKPEADRATVAATS
jgi:hypothetical protein